MSGAQLFTGDCLLVMADLANDSIDAIVTDPPYGLGFMGKAWDKGVPGVAFWQEMLRVAKPGAYLLAFGGSRTSHRMACAIEDAGWEIRDTIMWLYGSGFPKSHNGPWGGTALKPAHEPIIMARKPLVGTVAANVLAYGTGALNIDGCRVPGAKPTTTRGAGGQNGAYSPLSAQGRIEDDGLGRWPANVIHDGSEEVLAAFPDAPGQLAKASTSDSQRAGQNAYGVMARGSNGMERREEADTSAARFFYCAKASRKDRNEGLEGLPEHPALKIDPTSAMARDGRRGSGMAQNTHPTVKPTKLMRYLVRLVTPKGGTVLDPFAGSGSTGKAAVLEWCNFIGIDLDADYTAIAERRVAHAVAHREPQQEDLA